MAAVVKGDLSGSADKIYSDVKNYYESKFHLTWLATTNINNGYAMIVKPAIATKYNLKTLSDLGPASKDLVFGAEAGFKIAATDFRHLKTCTASTFGSLRTSRARISVTAHC